MQYTSNGLSKDQNKDHVQNLCHHEVDVPTYHFWVNKIVGFSYSRVMFRVDHIKRNGIGPFKYLAPR